MGTNIDYTGLRSQGYFQLGIGTSYVWYEKIKDTLLNLYLINKII